MKNLKKRVKACRNQMKELKALRFYFVLKYPQYAPKNSEDTEAINRLDNLWYGKVLDEEFTEKLEAFTKFKLTQYKINKN
jgi:hypothetical protein